MTPGEAAYKWVSGRSLRTEQRLTLSGQIAEINRSAGSKAAAARAAGVSPTTWRRWSAGTQKPKPGRADALTAAVRRGRLSPAREAKLRAGGDSLAISADVQVSSDVRNRDITIEADDLDQLAVDGLVDAFLAGAEPAELAERLDEVIWSYVPGMHVLEVDTIG